MKKHVIIHNINQLIYFFISNYEIKTAIFSKMKFPSSPNYYKYIILKDNLFIYLGAPWGLLGGTMGLLWGSYFLCFSSAPNINCLILNRKQRLGELGNLGEPLFTLLKSWITGFQPSFVLLSYKKNILLILIYLLIIRVLLFYLFISFGLFLFCLSIGVIFSWIWIRRKKAELLQQDQRIYATSEDVTC